MKIKKIKIFGIMMVAVACVIGIALFESFSARPIIENASSSRILNVQYNPYFKQETNSDLTNIDLTDDEEQQILDYLSNCTERRSFHSAKGYYVRNVQLQLDIHTENGLKTILLGADSYSYRSFGKPKYKIDESDRITTELLAMLNIDSSK